MIEDMGLTYKITGNRRGEILNTSVGSQAVTGQSKSTFPRRPKTGGAKELEKKEHLLWGKGTDRNMLPQGLSRESGEAEKANTGLLHG